MTKSDDDTSKKIRDLKVLVAAPTDGSDGSDGNDSSSGKGQYRNAEQDIAGYLLNLYFLSKYKFFSDRGFEEYKKNMRYFRTLGEYSAPFIDMYKELLGDKATDQRLAAFEQAGKLARALNYRPVLLKTAFRPLRTQASKVPHVRLKQFVRSISHYFEHGSVPDAALEKAMIEEVRPVIKHYRMKRMLKDISKNLDELVKAGNLYEDEVDPNATPAEQAAAKASPPKPKVYKVEELKQLGKMELLQVLRDLHDEKDYDKILEATDDKAVLAYLANVKAYFSDKAVAALKDARIFKRAWVAKLRPAAKLALIKAHDRNAGSHNELPDYWFAVKIFDNATPAVLEAWLKAKFYYGNPSSPSAVRENTIKEMDRLFKHNPELLTQTIINLLLKHETFKIVTLERWMPDSIAMTMKDTTDPSVLVAIINRSKPADAVQLLRENINKFKGRLIGLRKSVPAKWRLIAGLETGFNRWWSNYKHETCAEFLADAALVREFEFQAKALVENLSVEDRYQRVTFKEIYTKFPFIRGVLIKFGSQNQLFSLEGDERDEDALAVIREYEKEGLSQQQAWFGQNWSTTKSANAMQPEFEEVAIRAPATELPGLYDAAMNKYGSANLANKFGERMPDEYCYKLVANENLYDGDRKKYAERVPTDQWAQYLNDEELIIRQLVVKHCQPDFLPTVLAHQNYRGELDFLRVAIPRLLPNDLAQLWESELKDRFAKGEFDGHGQIVRILAGSLPEDQLAELGARYEHLSDTISRDGAYNAKAAYLERLPTDQLSAYITQVDFKPQLAAILVRRVSAEDFPALYDLIKSDDKGLLGTKTYKALIERLSGPELAKTVLKQVIATSFTQKEVIFALYKKLPRADALTLGRHIIENIRFSAYTDTELDVKSFASECMTLEDFEALKSSFRDTHKRDQVHKLIQGDRVDQFLGNLKKAEDDNEYGIFLDQLFAQNESGDSNAQVFADQALDTLFHHQNTDLLASMLASGHQKLISQAVGRKPVSFVLENVPSSEIAAHFDTLFGKLFPFEIKDHNRWDLNEEQQAFMKNAPGNKLITFYEWCYNMKVLPLLMQEILVDRIKEWKPAFKDFFLTKGRDFRRLRWAKGSFPLIHAADDSEVFDRIERTRIGRDLRVGDAGDVHKHYRDMQPLEQEKYITGLQDRVLVDKIFYGELYDLLPRNTKVEQSLSVSTSKGGTNDFIKKIKTKYKETSLSVAVAEILQYKSLDEVKQMVKDDPLAILEFARPAASGDTIIDETTKDEHTRLEAELKKTWDHTEHRNFKGAVSAAYIIQMKAGMKKSKSSNIMTLYHGTSFYAAGFILQNGFKVMKNPTTGRAFGDGIYFTDISSKAAQYLGRGGFGRGEEEGVMIVCEVDLGNMQTYTKAHSHNDRKIWMTKGFDSFFAPKDVQSLRNSEYIIADVNRIRVKYVLTIARSRSD